jgi:BirA family biotin operon repressor/biotin-[acetyl-CoA-carboxylase] ligase
MIMSQQATECAIAVGIQTAGIGRCERRWESDWGNLFMSVIKKLPPRREFGQLSMAIACAVHEAISYYIPEDLYLHWPNDIYYKKSKIAGILVAVVDGWMVISVGVNVNSRPSIEQAACIKDIAGKISTDEIMERILDGIDKWFCNLSIDGVQCLKEYWLRYINELGCKITVRNGHDSVSGVFRGMDDLGRLILEQNGSNLLISSGDMFLNMEGIVVSHE